MQNDVQIYTLRGVLVTKSMLDRQLYPLMVKIRSVDINITSAAEHAPEV